jgi:signal transduction histidine kinase
LGWELLATEPKSALKAVEEAEQLFSPNENDAEFCEEAGLLRGCAWMHMGMYADASALLAPLLATASNAPVTQARIRGRAALGISQVRQSNTEVGFALLRESLGQAISTGDQELEGQVRMFNGIACNEQGRRAEAIAMLTPALQCFLACGNRFGVAKVRGNLGNTHFAMEEYDLAAEHYMAGLEVLRQLGDRRGEAVGLGSLGRVYVKLGELDRAIDFFSKANAEFRALGIALEEVIGWNMIGQTYVKANAPLKAIDAFRQGLALAESNNASAFIGSLLFGLAESCALAGQLDEAANAFSRALQITSAPGQLQARAEGLLGLARVRQANDEDAIWRSLPSERSALEEAVALAAREEVPSVAREARLMLARICEKHGEFKDALCHNQEYYRLQEAFWQQKSKQALARAEVYYAVAQHRKEAEMAQAHAKDLSGALEEARREHDRAERESRQKSELLSIVAHDLRNAVTHISLVAEVIRINTHDASLLENCHDIDVATNRLDRLIRTLLDQAALEEGRLVLQSSIIDLSACANAVWKNSVSFARRKNQELRLNADRPCPVFADNIRVEEVIQNLVDNAIKYTPNGKRISITVFPGDEVTRLSVHDEGLGMSADDMTRAFERFAQLSSRPTGDENSTGLGLSIARQLIEAMRGRVWVESAGKTLGSTFWIELPVKPPV